MSVIGVVSLSLMSDSYRVFPDISEPRRQADDRSAVSVSVAGNTLWLIQRQPSEIVATSTDNSGLHLKNIDASGELVETGTTEDFSLVQQAGERSALETLLTWAAL